MTTRLSRPVTFLAQLNGPVRIGKFTDGTLLVAGPNDEPILIREGCVMRVNYSASKGEDTVFSYEGLLEAVASAKQAGG